MSYLFSVFWFYHVLPLLSNVINLQYTNTNTGKVKSHPAILRAKIGDMIVLTGLENSFMNWRMTNETLILCSNGLRYLNWRNPGLRNQFSITICDAIQWYKTVGTTFPTYWTVWHSCDMVLTQSYALFDPTLLYFWLSNAH